MGTGHHRSIQTTSFGVRSSVTTLGRAPTPLRFVLFPMIQRRVHPKVVRERLGHASVTITLDRYSHVIPNLQDEAAAKIGAVVDSN